MLCVRDGTRVAGMARVMAEGWSCGEVAFLRHFCSDLGARHGLFELAKSEKSAGVA